MNKIKISTTTTTTKKHEERQNRNCELKNTRTELTNPLERINVRLIQAQERNSNLEEDRSFEIVKSEENKRQKNEYSLMELQKTIKQNSMCIMGIPEGRKQEKRRQKAYLKT